MRLVEPTCIIMLRAPQLGRVKTRLAQSIGPDEALRIYRLLVERQVAQVPKNWRTVIQFTPANMEGEMRRWLGGGPFYRCQEGHDLGERMIAAVLGGFADGSGPCFLIGGDCPGLDRPRLESAEALLRDSDVVIGPASDGGYTLLGLKEPRPNLLRGVAWGTPEVLGQTLARTTEAGLTVSKLPVLEDVDDIGSWERNRHLLD